MGHPECKKCHGCGGQRPQGYVWWNPLTWGNVACEACGGDGIAKPRGWPDRAEIEKYRPPPPSAPPRPPSKYEYYDASSTLDKKFDELREAIEQHL